MYLLFLTLFLPLLRFVVGGGGGVVVVVVDGGVYKQKTGSSQKIGSS